MASRLVEWFKKMGLEIYVILMFALTVIALFAGAGAVLLRILLSAAFGFLALLIAGNKLENVFNKFGVGKYWRTITIICFVIIGLWNWLVLILLLAFLIVWSLL